MKAWIFDESDAYRQIPVHPEHRRFAVIVVRRPGGGIAFFIMIGHSFGLLSAVYNYNRRSAILDEILKTVFWIPSSFYYDDKFGIESHKTIASADQCVANLHKIGGCDCADKKRYVGDNPTILSVTYDLVEMILAVKEDRKEELIGLMREMMAADRMTPGEAAELKGELGFAGSHF